MKNKLCLIGSSSNIIKEFLKLLDEDTDVTKLGKSDDNDISLKLDYHNYNEVDLVPMDCDRYVISLGYLLSKKITEQTREETLNSMAVNLLFPVNLIEKILEKNQNARILILGSESGFKGSYDTSYFIAKAAMSSYVREKHINYYNQQLVMIAPSVILDTKMTQERKDLSEVLKREDTLPKKRYLMSKEIANTIYHCLYIDKGYINNEIININGGKFARMNYK